MLLTQLLAEHPEAAADIVRHTPLWVAGVLAGLTALGLSAARTRQVHFNRLVAMPLVMGGLALWGVQSAFGASGRLPSCWHCGPRAVPPCWRWARASRHPWAPPTTPPRAASACPAAGCRWG